jgi:hypothetical protein
MFAEDLSIFFRDFGDIVSWTPSAGGVAVEGLAIYDSPNDLVLGNAVLVRNGAQLLYPTGKFPGLDEDEVVIRLGVQWRIQETPKAIDDGQLMQAMIMKV